MSATELNSSINELLRIMAKLRDPDGGCPWDLKQDYRSIVPHTIEEAYEVADAIERDDMASLKDELGDLLFQVVFYTQLASEENHFSFTDVVEGLSAKLVRRHPHVFTEQTATGPDEVNTAWENLKQEERASKARADGRAPGVLDDVPLAMPSLSRAAKLQKRASRVGFDWPAIDGALAKVHEETAELETLDESASHAAVEHELGDLLFSVVNVARFHKVDPERALRYANQRFSQRFRWIEQHLANASKDICDTELAELDRLWKKAKQTEPPKQ